MSIQNVMVLEPSKNDDEDADLLHEEIKPRKNTQPLLEKLADRPPEPLHYMGVSYGLTQG